MRVLIFSAVLLAAACSPPPAPPPPPSQHVTAPLLRPDQRTILNGPEALQLAHQCSRVSPGPVESQWTPTEAQIAELEPTLATVIAAHLQANRIQGSPSDYWRQYAGFVIHGRRVIYVNGLANAAMQPLPRQDPTFDWRTQALGICDGGSITFGVEYDVETTYFSLFNFNGAPAQPQ